MNAMTESDLELTPEEGAAAEPPVFQFATIGEVFADGVTLIFDGEEEATEKHYRVNAYAKFAAGDRVKICADSGTYVVEYVVGNPGEDLPVIPTNHIPSGGSNNQLLAKDGDTAYALKWVNPPSNYIPTGGTDGQYLAKSGAANYGLKWVEPPTANNYIPTGGTDGQYLAKDGSANYSLKWANAPANPIPTGGSDGQYLAKSGSSNYALKWVNAPSNPLPTGGAAGQVLTKDTSSNYDVSWKTVSPVVSQLKYSTYTFTLNASKQLLPSTTGFAIGNSSYPLTLHASTITLYNGYRSIVLACNGSGKFTVGGTVVP